jgi:hypothetical protein
MARKFYILTTKPVSESHTSDVIAKSLKEIMEEYAIPPEKIQVVMRDAASSMKLGTELAEFESYDCFTHKFQLVCPLSFCKITYNILKIKIKPIHDAIDHKTKSVPIIKEQIELARRLVADYNRSISFQRVLSSQQDLIGAPKHTLLQVIKLI